MKNTIFLLFLLFAVAVNPLSVFALTNVDGFVFDENAELNYTGEVFTHDGYDILILNNTSHPYIYVREPGETYTWATYNWAYQYWVSVINNFDTDSFDLSGLFLSTELTVVQLNRTRPSQSILEKLKAYPVQELSVKSDQREPIRITADFPFDPDYVVNDSITEIDGYPIQFDSNNFNNITFFDKENHSWGIGVYNYERQYWIWTNASFDYASVDLRPLFLKIDLTKTELNREKPAVITLWGYLDKEADFYDSRDDPDFQDFQRYLEDNGVPPWQIDYYRHMASNPAKRGRALPPGYFYEESEIGIQPISFHLYPEDTRRISENSVTAGGMQLYFEHHKAERFSRFVGAGYYLRDRIRSNRPVKLILVEIYPLDGHTTDTLSSRQLQQEVERTHEEMFGLDFNIRSKQVTIDYDLFKAAPGEDPFTKMDRVFDEYIHNRFGTDALYLYYFKDAEAFREVDDLLAHPRIYGAYVADWQNKFLTYFHELGHSLLLFHHFESVQNAGLEEAHFSVPCIMNYRQPYKADYFCPLCTYALGLDPPVQSPNPFIDDGDRAEDRPVRYSITFSDNYVVLSKADESGRLMETGRYNFGQLQLQGMQNDGDFIIFHYRYPGGDSYLGRFSESMDFLSEYNMGSLSISHFVVHRDVVYAIYRSQDGLQYLGAFDSNMSYMGEVMLEEADVASLRVVQGGLEVQYRQDSAESLLVLFTDF